MLPNNCHLTWIESFLWWELVFFWGGKADVLYSSNYTATCTQGVVLADTITQITFTKQTII